jgi:hypothetical protein
VDEEANQLRVLLLDRTVAILENTTTIPADVQLEMDDVQGELLLLRLREAMLTDSAA